MFLYSSDAKGNSEHTGSILDHSVIGLADPITKEGYWPKPITRSYTGNCAFNGQGWGCVGYLRGLGICVPDSPTDLAKDIPVTSTELPPIGKEVLCVTKEGGYAGHVSRCVYDGEVLKSTVDSIGAHVIAFELFVGWTE